MGEIAEMILEGILCTSCGVYMEGDADFPRICKGCARALEAEGHQVNRTGVGGYFDQGLVRRKIRCDVCNKKVWEHGMRDHQRDVHGIT